MRRDDLREFNRRAAIGAYWAQMRATQYDSHQVWIETEIYPKRDLGFQTVCGQRVRMTAVSDPPHRYLVLDRAFQPRTQ